MPNEVNGTVTLAPAAPAFAGPFNVHVSGEGEIVKMGLTDLPTGQLIGVVEMTGDMAIQLLRILVMQLHEMGLTAGMEQGLTLG